VGSNPTPSAWKQEILAYRRLRRRIEAQLVEAADR